MIFKLEYWFYIDFLKNHVPHLGNSLFAKEKKNDEEHFGITLTTQSLILQSTCKTESGKRIFAPFEVAILICNPINEEKKRE